MSNATIKQYGEMGIRLETLHNSHQMSSWPCSVLVNHFIIHTLYRAPQMFKMFEKHSVILDQTQARPRTVMIWMISVVWEGVSVGQSPGCWDDCWNAEQTQTPQLTGRGWALIWECQNLLLSHQSRGEADYLFINEISWQCVSVWHISEHILSNEDDKILEFSQTILIDNKHQRRNY